MVIFTDDVINLRKKFEIDAIGLFLYETEKYNVLFLHIMMYVFSYLSHIFTLANRNKM